MRRRGFTMLQVLVAAICASVIGAGTIQAFISLHSAYADTTGQTEVQTEASDAVGQISAAIRRAPACTKKHGCGNQDGSAFAAAAAKDVTVHGNAPGQDVRFWEENGSVFGSGPGGTQQLAEDASLDLTYYAADKRNSDNLVVVTPDASRLPQLIAVDVAVTVNSGRNAGTYRTTVRLRNSPADND